MTDKEQIIKELGKNIKDVEEQKFLFSICDEIFEEYDRRSSKAVSELLQGKIKTLKYKFEILCMGIEKRQYVLFAVRMPYIAALFL